jgi:hypothetical protein
MAIEIVDLAIKIWMFHSYVSLPEGSSFGNENTPIFSDKPWKSNHKQGLVNVPFWEYWTSPYSSHYHIPNGWVMFNGDI